MNTTAQTLRTCIAAVITSVSTVTGCATETAIARTEKMKMSNIAKVSITHRSTHGPQTYVRRPWLIVLIKLGYSFNVHA